MSLDYQWRELLLEAKGFEPPETSAFINKVPDVLLNSKIRHFFEPHFISIGPLHAEKPNLSAGNEIKKRYLKSFLLRLERMNKSEYELIKLLIDLEPKARDCYKGVDFNNEIGNLRFIQIMLLDGCFLVELLLGEIPRYESQEISDYKKKEIIPWKLLQHDLLKLENQLPFFVLENISQLCLPSDSGNYYGILTQSVWYFFDFPKRLDEIPRSRHLLELVMNNLFSPTPHNITGTSSNITSFYDLYIGKSASELELYGIKFKPKYFEPPTHIRFIKGVMKIPIIEIEESTESLFWNFLVFELCTSDDSNFVQYLLMIDNLVHTEKDVDLLLRSGVLRTKINDKKKLVSLFNDLSVYLLQKLTFLPSVKLKHFFLYDLIIEVNIYCESYKRRMRAYIVRNYYDARWDLLNSGLLFILTVTQTLFSILAYNPKQK